MKEKMTEVPFPLCLQAALEDSPKWQERYFVLPLYKNQQEAYAACLKDSKAFVPVWGVIEKHHIESRYTSKYDYLFYHKGNIIPMIWARRGSKHIEVISIHMTKAIAEKFAKSYHETPERILLSD